MNTVEKLHNIQSSIFSLAPEVVISAAIIFLVICSLFKKLTSNFCISVTLISSLITLFLILTSWDQAGVLFMGMLTKNNFTDFLKVLMNLGLVVTCMMTLARRSLWEIRGAEYGIFLLTITLGSHLLVMSNHLLMVFLSLEVISITSYVLAGYGSGKQGAEASLKYFLFGSAASALMLYGFSILYGLTGTLDFTSEVFIEKLITLDKNVILLTGVLAFVGFLFKISAAPMHLWAPDVYEGAPTPTIAFFSVVPKLAGLGVFIKFVLSINAFGQSQIDWQFIVAVLAILTITVGNFSALAQTNVKRLMGYSSIAQSGFLLAAMATFLPQGIHFMLFYAAVYTIMNFAVFLFIQYFEEKGFAIVADYSGTGKTFILSSILLLLGLVALTGLPPTAGFTGKLFIFSGLWDAYQLSGKSILLWLLVFGLLNTVVSLFYYLKIPFYAYLKDGRFTESPNFLTFENLLGLILVLLLLVIFFLPGLLMGWINKVNFVF